MIRGSRPRHHMSATATDPEVLVLSGSWHKTKSELSFVTRVVAGAASRTGIVNVVTPIPADATEADGAFDVRGIGQSPDGDWPTAGAARWTRRPSLGATWILDEPTDRARELLAVGATQPIAYSIAPLADTHAAVALPTLPLIPDSTHSSHVLGVHVPINPLAGEHRHGGLGMTGYILVLTDRSANPAVAPPTDGVAWLTSRFHDQYVIVVEGGRAAVWRGRALRGVVEVDTRTDLWRLMAHAHITVDLAPGDIIARECIESLRFGTPVVAPVGTTGAAHAQAGGGVTFTDAPGLLDAVEQLLDSTERARCAGRGQQYAEALYGDPAAFVAKIARALWPPVPSGQVAH